MLEFYPAIRSVHIMAIGLSGAWMALRLLAQIGGMRWQRHWLGWSVALAIDGTVLTLAAMLYSILPTELFANHWLTEKLVFVSLYFVAGYTALIATLRRGLSMGVSAASLAAYAVAYHIARTHVPFLM